MLFARFYGGQLDECFGEKENSQRVLVLDPTLPFSENKKRVERYAIKNYYSAYSMHRGETIQDEKDTFPITQIEF